MYLWSWPRQKVASDGELRNRKKRKCSIDLSKVQVLTSFLIKHFLAADKPL